MYFIYVLKHFCAHYNINKASLVGYTLPTVQERNQVVHLTEGYRKYLKY